ncbi:MAG: GNAT family N-acetyltransferase [Deltaproteobacteria bacterium]|jgi:acyl-CoA hydrolase/GNAT superfamily N-acetyltransferase|nr:GNAT family N-acetyltransferase [Deltaproteobacteria bacterium]
MSEWKDKVLQSKGSELDILRQIVRDGLRLYIGSGCGEPQHLVRCLLKVLPEHRDIEIVQNLSMGSLPQDWKALEGNARLKTFFVGPRSRDAVNEGMADYIPIYFSSIPRLFKEDPLWKFDIALVQVSPPDEHGFCSMGISVGMDKSAVESASIVFAQINREMPRTLGDSFVHSSRFHYIVEYDEPLPEIVFRERSAVAERIARYISPLIEDGSTIQTGAGRIPNWVLIYLEGKKDLGIHTEVLTDAHLHLINSGAVTGLKKTLNHGKIVATYCMGSRQLYDFVNNNPEVEIYPTEYVHNRTLIRQHHRMVAINSALEIDLSGQICAESMGHKVYSGIGGYVDFMQAASSTKEGKAIIVLPSTTSDGRKSRIVSHLTNGAGVVSPRSTVSYVATEFGVAYLHGKTIRERALALINIAHPRFREQLMTEAKKIHYVYEDQIVPPIYEPLYPGQWETRQVFPPNENLYIRPVKPTDERSLQEFFYALPFEDIYFRFLSAMKAFPHRNIQAMCNLDYEHEMAVIAVTGGIGAEKIAGISRYILDQKTNFAEIDVAVASEWQHKGIGTFLVHYISEIAKTKGISGLVAYVLAANRAMLAVFHCLGYAVHSKLEEGIYEVSLRFDQPALACRTEEYK